MTPAPPRARPARFAPGEQVLAGVPATVSEVFPADALGRRAYMVEVWAPEAAAYVKVRVADEGYIAPVTSRPGRAS